MPSPIPPRVPRPGLHRFAVLARHLPTPADGGHWLELGGGAGEFAALVAEKGYEVTLLDSDPRNVARVVHPSVHPMWADLNQGLPQFETASFDGASLIEVIEHIPLAEGLLQETYRVLKPGGILLLSTPNALWWRERWRALCGLAPSAEGYHFRYFTVAGTRRIVTSAGFTIQVMEFSTPAFGLNWLRRRVLRKSKRRHLPVPRFLASLLAQTVYVVARKE